MQEKLTSERFEVLASNASHEHLKIQVANLTKDLSVYREVIDTAKVRANSEKALRLSLETRLEERYEKMHSELVEEARLRKSTEAETCNLQDRIDELINDL